ncbi:uncharacterized protein LTR77_002818 [Saxophila tyrrhenica]|uniref:Uncharacterized protein n=1 Tax=Saxophila tyrrhenica TaxID=1690608 RepID=A0AAV9PK23_9PEZI|nr:hypothetical protein LTR77_002818 [Saxophila tyrrhenica]
MAPWLRFLEAYMVQMLLRTPAFHRGVEKVARSVHRIRHGTPPEELGGTKIDGKSNDGFLRHFSEEVQTQLGRAEAKNGETAVKNTSEHASEKKGPRGREWAQETEDETADAAWQNTQKRAAEPPKQGFLDEYMGALREQLRK